MVILIGNYDTLPRVIRLVRNKTLINVRRIIYANGCTAAIGKKKKRKEDICDSNESSARDALSKSKVKLCVASLRGLINRTVTHCRQPGYAVEPADTMKRHQLADPRFYDG